MWPIRFSHSLLLVNDSLPKPVIQCSLFHLLISSTVWPPRMRKSGLVKDKHLWAAYITRPVRAPCVGSLWLPSVLLHLMKSKCWFWKFMKTDKLMSQGMFKLQIAKDMVICWQTEWQWARVMYNITWPPDASHSKHSFAEQHGSLRGSDIDPLTVMADLSYDLELYWKIWWSRSVGGDQMSIFCD